MHYVLAVLLAMVCIPWSGNAKAAKHAFVVGIDTYDNIRSLKKARGDARGMEQAFAELGFAVQRTEDVTRTQFNSAWQDFLLKIAPGDAVALFFAGHGVELGGQVHLVPRDVPKLKAGRQDQLKRESILFPDLLDDLKERKAKFSLIILDACRENPFDDEGRSIGKDGLPQLKDVEGTFIMYSAGARQLALDRLDDTDASPNSVYTRTLLQIMRTPGLPLNTLARNLARSVNALAATVKHEQTPAYYDGIPKEDVCLAGGACGAAPQLQMYEAYEKARASKSVNQLREFIAAYRAVSSTYADMAQEDVNILEGRSQPRLATIGKSEGSRVVGSGPAGLGRAPPIELRYWKPGQELRICFRSGTPSARLRVKEVASEWLQYANLKFDFGDAPSFATCKGDKSEDIKIDFQSTGSDSGYWSYTGTDSRKFDHSMNLAGLGEDLLPVRLADARRFILHDFGHALGLEHQHQNPRSNCDPEFDQDALNQWANRMNWSKSDIAANLEVVKTFDPLIDYDKRSIMHYSLPPELYKQGKQNRCWTEPNFFLSDYDKHTVARIYPSTRLIEARAKLTEEFNALLKRSGFPDADIEALSSDFKERLETTIRDEPKP